MGRTGLSFTTREQAIGFARQQQEDGLYPIVFRTKGEYHVVVCESQQEYATVSKSLQGQIGK